METEVKAKIVKEMIYTVPLKYAWCGPHNDRTRKAVMILKKFLIKHMKSKNVHITEELNEELWKHGVKNPPRRVKIRAVLLSTGEIWATLPERKFPFEKEKESKVEKKEVGEVKKEPEKTEEKIEGQEQEKLKESDGEKQEEKEQKREEEIKEGKSAKEKKGPKKTEEVNKKEE